MDDKIQKLDIDCDEFLPDETIHVICRLLKDADLTRVEGAISAPAFLECARCLEPFSQTLEGDFSIIVRQLKRGETAPQYSENDEEGDSDSLVIIPYGEDSLDITEYVHDALLLAIPLKPICSEDCKGLCPQCGANLNQVDCGCPAGDIDPRLAGLKKLLK